MRFNLGQLVQVKIGRLGHWFQLVQVKIGRLGQKGILADEVTSKVHHPDDVVSYQSLDDIMHCYASLPEVLSMASTGLKYRAHTT